MLIYKVCASVAVESKERNIYFKGNVILNIVLNDSIEVNVDSFHNCTVQRKIKRTLKHIDSTEMPVTIISECIQNKNVICIMKEV